MKLVREHIFEKFIEDSDPITDMGIGILEIMNLNPSTTIVNEKIYS